MATKLPTTVFLSNGWRGINGNTNSRFQQKKQQGKNVSPEPLPISERFQQSDDESAEIKMAPVDIISHSDLEMSPNSDESTEVQNDKEDSIPSLNKESTSNNESDITFTDQNNSLGYLDSSTSSPSALDMVLESFFDENKVWIGTVEGLPVYFIEPLHPSNFFSRGQFYGEHDDFKRFSYFSRAALELLLQAGKKPDIIHCHDWQTAFVASLYWDLYAPKGLNSTRVVFTCHNFEYQGTANASELASCGLDVHRLNRPDRMQDHSARDHINPVKGAVVYSNIVTTVSPTYAQEVWTSQYSSTRKTSSLMARFSLTLLLLLSFMCFSSAEEDTRGREKISWIDDTTTASLPDGSMVLHGYLCIISYGIMIPLVAFFGRHRRFFSAEHDGLVWKIFHIGFSWLTVLIVVLDWILIRSIVSFTSLHSWLAVFISILGAIQILFVRNRRLHKIVGTLILVACILNIFEGIYLMEVTSVRGVFMFFIILISIFSIIMDYLPTAWSNFDHTVRVHVE